MHEVVCANRNSFVYEMKSLFNTAGKIVRFKKNNDNDVQFALGGAVGIPKVYVSVQPYQPLHEPNHQMFV